MVDSRITGRHLAPALVACALAAASHADQLSIDRLFDAPALAGPVIQGLQIAPDGSRVTFLQGKSNHKDRLDLWEYNIHDHKSRLLVDASILDPGEGKLSEEESNRRERQRTAALSGIVEYTFAPSGKALLFPLGGELYYYDLEKKPNAALTKITHGTGFASDVTISSKGGYVAFVRDQNLYAYDLKNHTEIALTTDGQGSIKNGLAEFIAQEEMGRSTGYWWSPDETYIAFAHVDETSIPVTQRFEIAADNVATYSQRYPAAGGPNAIVRLAIKNVRNGATTWIDLGSNTDIYLARVDWLPDGKTISIQRESRDQHHLDLLFADVSTGKSHVVLTETSPTWIELNDEITFLKTAPEFVWASARDGFTHLYLYNNEGQLLRRLTEGEWNVDDFRARAIKAVDEKRRTIYFTATAKTPIERHLYRTSLDSEDPRNITQLSQEAGIHAVTMSPDSRYYVDSFNSIAQPPQVSVRDSDGRLISYLLENRLNGQHPDSTYMADNSIAEYGTLPAADGQLLHYQLFKPKDFDPSKHYPAIVEVYGGPGVQRVLNHWAGSSFVQILTRAGYVVFQLDNRGTASRGVTFQSPIYGRLGDVEVADQVQGARWLATQTYVDPSRIGVWGWSYGGYMTLMLMFKAPEIFRAGVAGAPVTDWTLYDTHYTERYLGKPQDNKDGYQSSSALPPSDQLRGKLLIMHGMADDNVLFLNSTKLFRHLQDLNKQFDVMVYPGGKHGLIRQHDGRHAYATLLRFFNESLQP